MNASILATDMLGHSCCDHPLERHPFEGDDYECETCHRPRALHLHDGFIPSNLPTTLSTHPGANYRGPHPRWTRPGMYLRPDSDELAAARRKARAALQKQQSLSRPQSSGGHRMG